MKRAVFLGTAIAFAIWAVIIATLISTPRAHAAKRCEGSSCVPLASCSVDRDDGVIAFDRPGGHKLDLALDKGSSVLIESRKGAWVQVLRPSDAFVGWVIRDQINCSND